MLGNKIIFLFFQSPIQRRHINSVFSPHPGLSNRHPSSGSSSSGNNVIHHNIHRSSPSLLGHPSSQSSASAALYHTSTLERRAVLGGVDSQSVGSSSSSSSTLASSAGGGDVKEEGLGGPDYGGVGGLSAHSGITRQQLINRRVHTYSFFCGSNFA